jgi:ATP-dependent DNA helicase PIF1
LAKDPVDKLMGHISQIARKRWITTKILVIDEVSMLSADLFDKLSTVGKRIRNDHRPFGGIQLVLCGA